MMSVIQGKFGIQQARAICQIVVILCLMTCGACENQKEEIPKDHFRVTITEQIGQEDIQKMAGSWGVVVKDNIAKPVVLRFVIDTFSGGSIRMRRAGKWQDWEGWVGGGTTRLSLSNIRRKGIDRNYYQAVITLVALIDYHYRDPKPYPILLIGEAGGTHRGGICYGRRELGDFTINGQMLETTLKKGVYELGSSLEIAKFMGESINLEVTR